MILTLIYMLAATYSAMVSADYFFKWFVVRDTAEHSFAYLVFCLVFGFSMLGLICRIGELIYARVK